ILNNAGGGTLSGTLTRTAANGVATFNDLSIDRTGIGYTLQVTAAGLASATSNAFNIVAAAATKLLFNVQPTTAVAGVAISPAVTVRLFDMNNNLATNDNSTVVTIAILNNAGGG